MCEREATRHGRRARPRVQGKLGCEREDKGVSAAAQDRRSVAGSCAVKRQEEGAFEREQLGKLRVGERRANWKTFGASTGEALGSWE
eukprot:5846163-Pleurochrysis_carterae.AAC.2